MASPPRVLVLGDSWATGSHAQTVVNHPGDVVLSSTPGLVSTWLPNWATRVTPYIQPGDAVLLSLGGLDMLIVEPLEEIRDGIRKVMLRLFADGASSITHLGYNGGIPDPPMPRLDYEHGTGRIQRSTVPRSFAASNGGELVGRPSVSRIEAISFVDLDPIALPDGLHPVPADYALRIDHLYGVVGSPRSKFIKLAY